MYCTRYRLFSTVSLSALFLSSAAYGLPQGGAVAAGNATIAGTGASAIVTQGSGRAVIDWRSFDVGVGEAVTFKQPSAASVTLNRIHDQKPSEILGRISANGQVILANPNGMLFGKNSRIDVAGLVATTANIGADAFMRDAVPAFGSGGNPDAAIINEGTITAKDAGLVALVAPTVENMGTITAKMGRVQLAGASSFSLDLYGDGLVGFGVDPSTVRLLVSNSGRAVAESGAILLTTAAASSVLDHAINLDGVVDASSTHLEGGNIILDAPGGVVSITGSARADGVTGGDIDILARNLAQQGSLTAIGSAGRGGNISLIAAGAMIDSAGARADVSGRTGGTLHAGAERFYASGSYLAQGTQGKGGSIALTADSLNLFGSKAVASGRTGGGAVLAGGAYQGKGPLHNATTTKVGPSTVLKADATHTGNGGTVVVWSDKTTEFRGTASARGGGYGGNGGMLEVSSKDSLSFGGKGDAGAVAGTPGNLLLDPKNITISNAGNTALLDTFEFADPSGGGAAGGFGSIVTVLANGNVVITAPNDDFAAADAGAAYLFNGTTGAVISTLRGSNASDKISNGGVTTLTGGNYVIQSSNWNGNRGAVTWGSGTAGVSGTVDATNSLVGSLANDSVGNGGVTALTGGNYVVRSTGWNGLRGAATWGNGTTGIVGTVSAANSLVGTAANDRVSNTGVTALTGGNYVVRSSSWNGNRGAVTWGSGTAGVSGTVDATNSLVGSLANDFIGSGNITVLTGGNYVVQSSNWNGNRGAVTWGSGTAGVSGTVDATNSLVGTTAGDQVGGGTGVTILTGGNYVVRSTNWNGNRGAVTWGSGTAGVSGAVDATNSLVGSVAGALVGNAGVTALTGGNYVVQSTAWNGSRGAATWGSGTTGVSGTIDATNSLVGTTAGDQVGSTGVTALTGGNYVVRSTNWNSNRGAVTWGSGTAGVSGAVDATNSLVGTAANDQVGNDSVTALTGGNYVVRSGIWNGNRGAVTWGSGTTGVAGAVDATNSLVGSLANDYVGNGNITVLTGGNYIVRSSSWNGNRGAVTWGSGTAGVSGAVDATNSLVGTAANDRVGFTSVTPLAGGNYVVGSANWNGSRGAATWGSGTTGVSGTIDATNSLVGTAANDRVASGSVTALTNGNYVVRSQTWNGNRGAVTWGSGTTGVAGAVSATNSLVGSLANDAVGNSGVTALTGGNYVVRSQTWNGGRGAASFGDGASGLIGEVNAGNSILGTVAGVSPIFSVTENQVTGKVMVSNAVLGKAYSSVPVTAENVAYTVNRSTAESLAPSFLTATLDTGTDVVLQASNDITVNDPIVTNNAGGTGGDITLSAGRSLILNAGLVSDGGDITLIGNDDLASGVVDAERDAGAANIVMAPGVDIDAGNGAVTIRLEDGAGKTNATGGDITLRGIAAGSLDVRNLSAGGNITFENALEGMDLSVTGTGDVIFNANQGAITPLGAVAISGIKDLTADSLFASGFTLTGGTGDVTFSNNSLHATGDISIDTTGDITGGYHGQNGHLYSTLGDLTALVDFDTLDISGASALLTGGRVGLVGAFDQAMANRIFVAGIRSPWPAYIPDPAYTFEGFQIGVQALPSPSGSGSTPPALPPLLPPAPGGDGSGAPNTPSPVTGFAFDLGNIPFPVAFKSIEASTSTVAASRELGAAASRFDPKTSDLYDNELYRVSPELMSEIASH